MSMSDATEHATLLAHLVGTDLSYRANATQWIALFDDNAGTEADLEAGGRTYELTYTPYIRIEITKASAWSGAGSTLTNAGIIEFAKRTDDGATQTAKYFAIVDTASGDFTQCIWGELSATLDISKNIQPRFAIGTLSVVAT
jgi:hypothetical protein